MAECEVCGDRSPGNCYGTDSCESSRLIFKRSVQKHAYYRFKVASGSCSVDKLCRNMCHFCRMKRCVVVGTRDEGLKTGERRPKIHHLPHRDSSRYLTGTIFQEAIESDPKGSVTMPYPRLAFESRHESLSSIRELADNHTETASRWLFMTIKWAKNLPYFAELYYPDQLELLRHNWSRLFLFNLLHFEIVPSMERNEGTGKAFKELFMRWSQNNLRPEIPGKFDHSLEKLRRLKMDETETLLIKSLLLFNPETEGLVDASQVQVTQNKCHRALEEHASSTNPGERERSGRILLTILTLSTFEERDIESMFLSTVLGSATVTSLMENILCAETM